MKDRFSQHAKHYAQFRPTYPPELYEFIFSHVNKFEDAWDAGTGSGQSARALSVRFKCVYATDISGRQLEHAYQADNIFYSIANERTSFPDNYFDLITAAQAAHWFNMPLFCEEATRVSKDKGIIALWGYSLLKISAPIDELIAHFYYRIMGPYWDKERRHIDEHFRTLYFPFETLESPFFSITVKWTLAELEGYLNTWSAVQKYIFANQQNPVDELIKQIVPHWKESVQTINFPLFLKLGRIHK